jgi:phosphomannomutase/phosphoglucomutase
MKQHCGIFRSYDIRGIVNKEIDRNVAKNIGKAFGTYLNGKKDVIVGRDMRLSGEQLKKSFVSGLTSTGCNVIDIGMVPTPLVYFGATFLEMDGGVSITASHNPPKWNGFKLRGRGGVGLYYEDGLKEIEQLYLTKDFITGKSTGIVSKKDVRGMYINQILARIKLEKPLKVIIDVGNGMGGIAEAIYRELGCEVKTLFKNPDGNFPNHIPNPTISETLNVLRKTVVKEKADIGIAFDADCDRVVFVDNKGRIVTSDIALIIFTRHVLSKHPKFPIVCDIRSPSTVIKEIEKLGSDAIVSRAGSAYVMRRFLDEYAILAGEITGHFWFKNEWFGFDDGIFAGAMMLKILSESDKSLSRIVDHVPKNYFLPSVRINCPERKKEIVIENLKKKLSEEYNLVTLDGVKIVEKDWSLLVRPSRTEPEIEFVVESKKRNVNRIYKEFEKIVKEIIRRA